MEDKLLEHINFQRPPLIFSIAAGSALILSAVQFLLTGSTQTLMPITQQVYTPIKMPGTALKSIKLKRNPFLPPAQPDIKRHEAMPQPVLKGIIQNGAATMAIIEYGGQSGYYQNGDKIGSFTLQNVSTGSIILQKNGQTLLLKNGGQ